MKSLWALTSIFLFSCAAPQVSQINPDHLRRRGQHILMAELGTGERFAFDEPGGAVVILDSMIFGRTQSYDFVSLRARDVDSVYALPATSLDEIDSTTSVSRLVTQDGAVYVFDKNGARFFNRQRFITGRTLNGSVVCIPITKVAGGEQLMNYEELQASNGFQSFFAVLGIIGLVALRVAAENSQQ